MLDRLLNAWRARRVLLVGPPDADNLYTASLMHALGARPARIPPDAKAHTLCRAMTAGRIGAVIVPSAQSLSQEGDLFAQLAALKLLLDEMREAGVPLLILCAHENVYAPSSGVPYPDESAPLGGSTREGLYQAILQLYADGASRALMGDAVTTMICRRSPCLGSGHPAVRQYTAWCRALLAQEAPTIEHPGAQGVFLHPLDAALGALCAGSQLLLGEERRASVFNIGAGAHQLCANRSACLFLCAQEGSTRAAREAYPPRCESIVPLNGERLKTLCGFSARLDAKEALSLLMEHEKACAVSEAAAEQTRLEQAQRFLERL